MKHAPLLVLGCAAALLVAFHPMLLSGLARVPGDLGDARLINYLLEHGWRWLLRRPPHRDFWSPPVFYPAANTAAYSDLLLSAGPFYWCWRAAGLPADTAFQLWMLTASGINYLVMYGFLARVPQLRSLAAALGAVLFTAAACRVAEGLHPQLYPQFYTVVALWALVRFLEAGTDAAGGRRAAVWFGVFCVAAVSQIYASYYLGWLPGPGQIGAAVAACVRAPTRRALFGVLRRRRWTVLGWAAGAAALTAPLAWHYVMAAVEQGGFRNWGMVAGGLPAPAAWLLLDRSSWLYGWLPLFDVPPGATGLQPLGVGFVVPCVAVWGLWRRRNESVFRFLLVTAAVFVVVVTAIGPASLWIVVYFTVFRAVGGLRAAYRIVLLVLVAASVGAAAFVHDQKRLWAAAALALVCVLEQGRTPPTYSREDSRRRVAEVVRRVPPDCRAFLYTPTGDSRSMMEQVSTQLDAMGAALETRKPTVNGYSGNAPPHYPFLLPVVGDADELRDRADKLKTWCDLHGIDPATVAWIHD